VRKVLRFTLLETVMAGLVPAIHAPPLLTTLRVVCGGAAWMPGSRPGMTPSDGEWLSEASAA